MQVIQYGGDAMHTSAAPARRRDNTTVGGADMSSFNKNQTSPSIRRLPDADVRAIFDCLNECKPLPAHIKFTIIPSVANGEKLSPPSYQFPDGLYVLLRPHRQRKHQTAQEASSTAPRVPSHLQHLIMREMPTETCKWSLSGSQFPQPTVIQQRYCYPKGPEEYSCRKGGSLWTMFGKDGKEDPNYRILHVYFSAKRAYNKGVSSAAALETLAVSRPPTSFNNESRAPDYSNPWVGEPCNENSSSPPPPKKARVNRGHKNVDPYGHSYDLQSLSHSSSKLHSWGMSHESFCYDNHGSTNFAISTVSPVSQVDQFYCHNQGVSRQTQQINRNETSNILVPPVMRTNIFRPTSHENSHFPDSISNEPISSFSFSDCGEDDNDAMCTLNRDYSSTRMAAFSVGLESVNTAIWDEIQKAPECDRQTLYTKLGFWARNIAANPGSIDPQKTYQNQITTMDQLQSFATVSHGDRPYIEDVDSSNYEFDVDPQDHRYDDEIMSQSSEFLEFCDNYLQNIGSLDDEP